MRVLLDTHFVVALLAGEMEARFPGHADVIRRSASPVFVSVASIWEMAIKVRLGKLSLSCPPEDIPVYLAAAELGIVPVELDHVVASPEPLPATRDPFDRLLLAQCLVEDLRLATVDRALAGHPLAMRL